jgi:arginase family enzyme
MFVRILDLDRSVAEQTRFVDAYALRAVPMRDWGPLIRICCSFERFRRFETALADRFLGEPLEPEIVFCGSGDFHHVTLALLRRVREPFNLLVLDKHPDWMRGAPLVHCGTWLRHALEIPNLQRLFQVGADRDLDNVFRWVAPWRELRNGKITVFPAVRRLCLGGWRSVPHEPLRAEPDLPAGEKRLDKCFDRVRSDVARFPLYVSLDKDLMRPSDARVNWDSGRLNLSEVQGVLKWFIGVAKGRVAGVDVTGDWSPPSARGILRRVLVAAEHPSLRVDPEEAGLVNGRTNLALVETIRQALDAG